MENVNAFLFNELLTTETERLVALLTTIVVNVRLYTMRGNKAVEHARCVGDS